MLRRPIADWRQGAQIRHQIPQILHLHMRMINVRQCWIIVATVRRYPAHQGIGEIDCAPTTDAVFRVRRYVRNMEGAERRGQCEPAYRSRWPGEAWQDAHPPASNTTVRGPQRQA